MFSLSSKRRLLAATLTAALAVSAVPAAQASGDLSPALRNLVSDSSAQATVEITGTLRMASADPVPAEKLHIPKAFTATPTQQEPKVWAVIESDSGTHIAVDPDSPALTQVRPGDEITTTVELDAQAQRQVQADGLSLSRLADSPPDKLTSALSDVEPLTVQTAQVIKKAAAPTNVKHQAYVLVVADSGTPGQFTPEQAKSLTEDAASYWQNESLGSITSFTVTEQKEWKVNNSCTKFGKDPFTFWDQASRKFPGLDPYASGKHLVVFLPKSCHPKLKYTGMAAIGQNIRSGGPSMVLDDDSLTTAHEIGHNFSLGHSNLEMRHGSSVYSAEYMAMYGPMSGSMSGPNAYSVSALDIGFQHQLGLRTGPGLRSVPAAGTTSVNLSPVSGESGVRGLTFYDPKSKGRYYLEYRSGTDKDRGAFYNDGGQFQYQINSQILLSSSNGPGVRVYRIDTDRYGSKELTNVTAKISNVYHPALSKNQTYTAPGGAFKVSVGAVTSTSADVKVIFKAVPTKTKVSVSKARFGKGATVKVSTTGSVTPAGKVAIYDGKKKLKTLTLKKGKASYKLSPRLKVGKHKITARYYPSQGFSSSQASKTIRVYKAKSKATITMKASKAKTVKRGSRAKVTVKLGTVSKASPTGKVAVKVGKKTVSKAVKLKRVKGVWRATIRTTKLPKGKIRVVYSGNKTFLKTTYTSRYRVK